MKTRILVLFVVVFVLGQSQNLLQNPGFETWTGNMPDHWQRDDSIAVFQEDVFVHGGNFSVRESLFTQTQDSADFFQGGVVVSPNTEYTFSAWVWDNDIAGRLRLAIRWFFGTSSGNVWADNYTVNTATWQELTYAAVSPSNADSALVFLRAYDSAATWDGDAIFYIDDAYFGATAVQSPILVRSWHTPTNPGLGVTSSVYAYVVDDGTIDHDTLFYGINSLNSPITLTHVAVANDTFSYQIPGQTAGDTIFYYLKFIDNEGLTAISDTHAYYVGAVGVFVNEFYYDTPGTDSLCFIEVSGPGAMSLDGFTLVGVNGNGGANYVTIDLTGHTIPGDGFFVIGDRASVPNVDLVDPDANLENGPDNLELRYYGITVDAVGYGTLNGWVFTGEWLPAVDVEAGHSLGRYPDGYDTDNNAVDFNDYALPSPGMPNPAVGIVEHKVIAGPMPIPKVANPVRSGLLCGALINDLRYYPLTLYNTMGQVVRQIGEPEHNMSLPTGVYFIRLNNVNSSCVKLVVVN